MDGRISLAIAFPFLALLTPFTAYLTNRDYPLLSLEILLILAGVLCVATVLGLIRWAGGRRMYAISVGGLLTVAADYQFEWIAHGRTITILVIFAVLVALIRRFEKTMALAVTVFLCVFVISTFLRNEFESESGPVFAVPHMDAVTDGPPRFIHLILDAHLGVEGFPGDNDRAKELKRKIKQFYQRYGFKLYGGAYSHYLDTEDSIPNLVNFSAGSVNKGFITGERPPYGLPQNRYFQFLQRMGYRVHVMHGDYLDFCSSQDALPDSCSKFDWYALSNVAKLDIPVLTRTTTALAGFVASYTRYQGILNVYEKRVRPFLLSNGIVGPVIDRQSLWTRRPIYPFSVNAAVAMDALSESIQQLAPGHMLFAHVMLPHFPFVYREDCSPRAIAESMDDMEMVPLKSRTPEDRKIRYDQYLRQMECLYVKLDELFVRMQSSGVFDDSIVIVHGDHGGRLGLRLPTSKEHNQLTPTDYADGLSTLFAAKIPESPGGYEPTLYAINELLVQTLDNAIGRTPPLSVPRKEPFAYLNDGDRKPLLLVDMPWRAVDVPESTVAAQQHMH
ncbi:sulfatase-like hydrolase/transferase [Nitrospira sp. BLG_2]|uniref:sulfatase-like hydrolase/transferase n=1 Tax=Nitrospira sp. BLG_2 TaxID=3397507 RepID=UPI003B99D3AF